MIEDKICHVFRLIESLIIMKLWESAPGHFKLTHCGLVTQYSIINLGQLCIKSVSCFLMGVVVGVSQWDPQGLSLVLLI